MRGSVAFFAVLTFTLMLPVADAKPGYEWKIVAPAGSGCFAPKCEAGQFPMAIVPVTGFDDKLYLIGDRTVWTSNDGVAWNAPQAKTDWGERYGMRIAYFREQLWMLGGMRDWSDFRNDVWSSADGTSWKQVVTKAPWQPRRGHGTVVFKDRLWIIGGSLSSGRRDQTPTAGLNDVWSSVDGVEWALVTENASFASGECTNTVVFNGRIWVVGRGSAAEVWSSADGREWIRHTVAADWGPRGGYGAAVFNGKIWVYGGIEKNDVWYSGDGAKWILAFKASPWSTRSTVYSTVFKDRLLLYSGKTGRADTQQGEIWAMRRTE